MVVYRYNLGKLANVCHDRKVKTKEKAPEHLALIRQFVLTLPCQTQNEAGRAATKPRLRPTPNTGGETEPKI